MHQLQRERPHGKLAHWYTRPFLKLNLKKAAENHNCENKSQPKSFHSKKVIPGLTFASVTNSDQLRTAPVDKTEPAKKSKPVSVINQEGETTSGFISAMSEFRKLFQSFLGLIEAGKNPTQNSQGKVRDFSQKQWEETLTSLDTDDGSLWGLARSFRKKKSPIPTLKGHTTVAYLDAEKAETLVDSLENQFKLNDISNRQYDKDHTRMVSRLFTNDNNFDDNPTNSKPSEILTYINKLKIRKAPGREGILNKMVQNFNGPLSFKLITLLRENVLKVGYFPQAWKIASVTPILKPGKDPTLPESFRPISLLLILSNLAEKIILNMLCFHLNTNDILVSQPHGFRAELSISHQLLRVVEYIKTGFKDWKSTGAVFLDIQKPLIETSQTTICMYADDTLICAQSNELALITHFLHKYLAKLEEWFSIWKIALNVSKTEAIFFSHHIKKPPPDLYLHNTLVPWSRNTKYLGVTLDKRLTSKQHITHIYRNFNIGVAKVYPLITPADSNIKILETAQNKIIRIITNTDWFTRNDDLRSALKLKTVKEVFSH
ncbi:RNA-directed DNA polymerase from mobile element jockey [Trichonephila clavipes]|nr:RNA-directed DNA polymerase from mobile element jockey [Trichonephila clavipes]